MNHKDATHQGEHAAVVERRLWDEVQRVLATNRKAVATGSRSETSSLFKGLVFDDAGNRMSPVYANKAGCRYRYYVSQALLSTAPGGCGQSAAPAGPRLRSAGKRTDSRGAGRRCPAEDGAGQGGLER